MKTNFENILQTSATSLDEEKLNFLPDNAYARSSNDPISSRITEDKSCNDLKDTPRPVNSMLASKVTVFISMSKE